VTRASRPGATQRLWAIVIVVVAVVVAGALAVVMALSRPSIERTTWYMTTWSERVALPTDVKLSLYLDGDGYAGSSGVNDFHGSLTLNGNRITLGAPTVTTRQTGTPAQMAAERAYLAALPNLTAWQLAQPNLTLTGGDHNLVFTSG